MRHVNMLIVEDVASDADLVVYSLRHSGFEVEPRVVCTAEEMREALSDRDWDIVVSDYRMAGFDGLRALKLLRENDPDTPFILYSGVITEEDAVVAMREGAADFVSKQHMARLVPAIDRELRDARDRCRKREAERELRLEQERFRLLVEHATDLIMLMTPDGSPTYVSPAAAALGTDTAALLGHGFERIVHPADVPLLHAELRRLVEEGSTGSATFQIRVRHSDGEWRTFEVGMTNLLDVPAISAVLAISHDITERQRAEETLLHKALYDEVTDLPNRSLFLARLSTIFGEDSAGPSHLAAILVLEFGRVRLATDVFGSASGAELMNDIVEALREVLGPSDELASISAQEIAVLLPDIEDEQDVQRRVESLRERFDRPFVIDSDSVYVMPTTGVAMLEDMQTSPDEVLRNAEVALREMESGSASQEIAGVGMREEARSRLRMEADLRTAEARDQFQLRYQPVVRPADGSVVSTEALVRWERAPGDLVFPGAFIPLAEDTGVVTSLGRWVLQQALHARSGWGSPVEVAVNLSPRQFRDPSIVADVSDALERAGVEPSALTLELTESALVDDAHAAAATMRELKALGVRMALDDFGTGYSSLSYVRSFPFDCLKIDLSFTRDAAVDPDAASIVSHVILLAHDLGMTVIAEGVETEDQLRFYNLHRCDYVQGYLLGRPETGDQFAARLRGSSAQLGAVPLPSEEKIN